MIRFITTALLFLLFIPINLKAQQEKEFVMGLRNTNLFLSQHTTKSALNTAVQISQIGDYNSALLQLSAIQSNSVIYQVGNQNEINYYTASPYVTQTIQQLGDSNVITHYTPYSSFEEHKNFYQKGNNLNLFSNGTNSISKEMTVNQYGNSGTVYIFNR